MILKQILRKSKIVIFIIFLDEGNFLQKLLQKAHICKIVWFSKFQGQNMSFGVELHEIALGEAQTTSKE